MNKTAEQQFGDLGLFMMVRIAEQAGAVANEAGAEGIKLPSMLAAIGDVLSPTVRAKVEAEMKEPATDEPAATSAT
ncbi:hypothetical protein [Catenulispora pinisilvae]|uniref:hypothetical protein n=1 Tax=Catenulispora pinisilvae TaxID=2705253 RepID=UPI0018912821|nr:hypothetical protein [Catenulispora pinisilvae]